MREISEVSSSPAVDVFAVYIVSVLVAALPDGTPRSLERRLAAHAPLAIAAALLRTSSLEVAISTIW